MVRIGPEFCKLLILIGLFNLLQICTGSKNVSEMASTSRFSLIKTNSNLTMTTTSQPPFPLPIRLNGTSNNGTRRKFDPPESTPIPTVNEEWGGNCTDKGEYFVT